MCKTTPWRCSGCRPPLDYALRKGEKESLQLVLEGELEVTLGDEVRVLRAGEAAVVPPDVEHAARAITDCRAIVADSPVRDSVGGIDIR